MQWGSCGFTLILTCICAVLTVFGDLAPCPPCLSGKYEVSIMVPLFLQCDGAWWLPLTGLSWLPYNKALVHRVVMVTLRAQLLCSRLHYLSRHLPQANLLLMSLILNNMSITLFPDNAHPVRSSLLMNSENSFGRFGMFHSWIGVSVCASCKMLIPQHIVSWFGENLPITI